MTKRVALYARVSTDGQTVENQLDELAEAAKRHGWQVVAVYADRGISGTKGREARPEFDNLLNAISRRDIDMVAAWSVYWLGTVAPASGALPDRSTGQGLDLFLLRQGLDTSSPSGRAMFQMLGVFAEFEAACARVARRRGRRAGCRRGPLTSRCRRTQLPRRSAGAGNVSGRCGDCSRRGVCRHRGIRWNRRRRSETRRCRVWIRAREPRERGNRAGGFFGPYTARVVAGAGGGAARGLFDRDVWISPRSKPPSGMRVLIHAAAGGVGIAAVRLALRAGAEVFATAGSPAKRKLVQSMGVAHVFDSRSLSFSAAEIRQLTGGAGVDVVLNSLAGEFIAASFSVLAQGGCFLELGKRDIWLVEQAGRLRPDARYVPYDLGTEAKADPAMLASLMSELIAALESGELPPMPARVFEFDEARDALRLMAQARHTGKLVLRAPQLSADSRAAAALVRDDATYLITGGLGALGVRTARWLVDKGARHLVLVGRHAPGAEAAVLIQECERRGARIVVRAADVGELAPMRALFAEITRTMPPLRGVVHAAGALSDGVLLQQDWERWQSALTGKAHGARVLDELTRTLGLDFFVLYSAAGLLLGAAGQGPYAAANAELDAIAHARRSCGLPALSVAWGMWRKEAWPRLPLPGELTCGGRVAWPG